jgi:hypothetical protein
MHIVLFLLNPYSTRRNGKNFTPTILAARHTQIFPEAVQNDGLLAILL